MLVVVVQVVLVWVEVEVVIWGSGRYLQEGVFIFSSDQETSSDLHCKVRIESPWRLLEGARKSRRKASQDAPKIEQKRRWWKSVEGAGV